MDKDEATRDRRPMKARPFLSAAGAVLLSLLLLTAITTSVVDGVPSVVPRCFKPLYSIRLFIRSHKR